MRDGEVTRTYEHVAHLLPEHRGRGIREETVRSSEERLREVARSTFVISHLSVTSFSLRLMILKDCSLPGQWMHGRML